MSKPARNAPCPCGSGRKFKHCCWQPGPASPPRPAPAPLVDRRGKPLQLTCDRFRVADPQDLARRLSEAATRSGNQWLFREGDQLVAEADLQGETLELRSASLSQADRWRRRIGSWPGLVHLERSLQDMGAVQAPQAQDPAHRAFKASFFEDWLAEPLPALGDRTPLEASRDPALQGALKSLLERLEQREARLPAGDRYDFGPLKARLGVDI